MKRAACLLLLALIVARAANAEPLIWCQPFFIDQVPESVCNNSVRAGVEPRSQPTICARTYLAANLGLCVPLESLRTVRVAPKWDQIYDRMAAAARRDTATVQ